VPRQRRKSLPAADFLQASSVDFVNADAVMSERRRAGPWQGYRQFGEDGTQHCLIIQRHLLQVGHEREQHRPSQFCVAARDIAADAGFQADAVERAGGRRDDQRVDASISS
jgi:hypothetical protein